MTLQTSLFHLLHKIDHIFFVAITNCLKRFCFRVSKTRKAIYLTPFHKASANTKSPAGFKCWIEIEHFFLLWNTPLGSRSKLTDRNTLDSKYPAMVSIFAQHTKWRADRGNGTFWSKISYKNKLYIVITMNEDIDLTSLII